MKAACVDLKNQNEHSFIGKKKQKDGITATTKLAYNKVKIVAVNIVKVFLKMISLLIKKRQQSLVILEEHLQPDTPQTPTINKFSLNCLSPCLPWKSFFRKKLCPIHYWGIMWGYVLPRYMQEVN